MPPKFVRNISDDDLLNAKDTEKEKLLKDSDEEEDFFLRGPSTSTKSLKIQNDSVRRVQFQVDEVSSIMKENIGKIIERDGKLEDLEDKSELMSNHADDFRSSAKKMQRKMWWQNMKLRLIIGGIAVIIVFIIIIIVARSQ